MTHSLTEQPKLIDPSIGEDHADVVIVDDDASFSFMLKDYLLSAGDLNSKLFSNGDDFLKQYSHGDKSIIILDYDFGEKSNGLSILQKIRMKNSTARVIMVSSIDDLEKAIETMRKGATDYFLKTNKTVFANILCSLNKLFQMDKNMLN